jgi:raffinose/stachyose/melibiose transport system permease protein
MSATFAFARGAHAARRVPSARVVVLATGTLAIIYPLALFFLNSLKSDAQFIVDPLGLPTQWEFKNYVVAWVQADMSRLIFNSFLVSTASTLLAIVMSSTFAFGLYAYRFPGAGLILTSVVMMLTIPAQVYIIPLYVLVIKLHIINTYLALILPYAAGAMPLSVVLFSNTFAGLPRELIDAARMDGASTFAIYSRIVMPLARPVVGAIAVFAFTGAWNEFFLALVFMQDKEMFTLPLGMQVFATSAYSIQFTLLFAAFSISMLPMVIVYLLMQRQFIAGLAGGAMKG